MKIKQKIVTLMLLGTACFVVNAFHANAVAADCNGVKTSIITCPGADTSKGSSVQKNPIWIILNMVLSILTAGVGILAVGGIVYGAVLYASAADKAEQTKKAISIITNVVIGVIAYASMYLVINFLIPGGIFT